eukprot:Sdes_comp20169_c0_seq2m13339
MLSNSFSRDRLWLNSSEQALQKGSRFATVLERVRQLAQKEKKDIFKSDGTLLRVHISSENNFPTAAGLASSASGYACLVSTLTKAFGIVSVGAFYDAEKLIRELEITPDLSILARLGSGSACRSMYGGFVKWDCGNRADGSDSSASPICSHDFWPEMQVIVCVVSDSKKTTSSSAGMQLSVETSDLLKYRAEAIVPQRLKQMQDAILAHDFQTFALLTMKDSNQFHSVCMDTYPPIYYMNDVSKFIVHMITQWNEFAGYLKAAYTFDAGPNAVIYALKKDVPELVSLLTYFVGPSLPETHHEFYQGLNMDPSPLRQPLSTDCPQSPSSDLKTLIYGKHGDDSQHPWRDSVKYLIHTDIGPGPLFLSDESEHLLSHEGLPL